MPARRSERDPATRSERDPAEPAAYVEAVLQLVERIPPGRVMAYGAIADYLHDEFGRGSARRVGTIMARYGGPVPWHRVVNGSGRLPPGHEARARHMLEAEGVVFRGSRVPMDSYAWWPPHNPAPSDPPAGAPHPPVRD